jgi:hypothetical protein
MSKEVQMTFRVEAELRNEFANATAIADRPAAQVLRELMRGYIDQSRHPVNDMPRTEISSADMQRRRDAVNFARASVGLEGYRLSEDAEGKAREFINGTIDLHEFLEMKPNAKSSGR